MGKAISMTSSRLGNVNPWEVWLAKWEHPDGKGYKYRPVIILEPRDDGAVVMKITSSSTVSYPSDYKVEDWEEAGLKKPSIARVSQIRFLSFDDFGHDEPFGRMTERDVGEIRKRVEAARHNR